MKSRIISLPDISAMEINPEYLVNDVEDEVIEEMVEALSKTLGETVEVECAEANCGLICQDEAGETVLLYPDMHFDEVEIRTAREKITKGTAIDAAVNGESVVLTVQKILVTRACPKEQLPAKAGIEGVSTIEELKASLREKEVNKNKEAHSRQLVMEMINYLAEHSETEIDEEEISAWANEQARLAFEENMAMGIDLRITEDGMITDEEVLAMLAADMRGNFSVNLACRTYAEEDGFAPDEEQLRAVITEEYNQMGVSDEAEIENRLQAAVENEYFRFVYEAFMQKAEEVLR